MVSPSYALKVLTFLLTFMVTYSATAQQTLDYLFKEQEINGSITIYDLKNKRWHFSDSADANVPMQPASTFKIINLLIGLETGAIENESTIIRWPGKTDTTLYGYRPEIYKDITIKEAFEVSAGWAFVEMAKKIPRKKYLTYLTKSDYGNLNLSEPEDDFWNFGPMKISPKNQVEFLLNVYSNKTPFSKRNTEILKRVMITQEKDGITLHSKTGWTRTEGKHIGWWVGYVESKDNVYFFATRITKPLGTPSGNFGSLRKEITKAALKQMFGIEL